MKSREESFIGDTTIMIYKKIKSWGRCTHSVGALIPPREDHEWHKLKDRLEKYGVNMSKGGLMFAIKWANALMDVTCPIAEKTGYHPIGFTDDIVVMCAELIKDMDQDKLIEKSNHLRKDILVQTEHQLKTDIKKKTTG